MSRASKVMPMLSAVDFDRALAFYEQALGGRRVYAFPDAGEPVFVTLAFGDNEIGIGRMTGAPLHGRAQRPATGHRIELCINVADVDEAVGELSALGSTIVTAPADQPWGERVAYVEDPDGNLVMLAAPSR